jgi:hypothetical protein
MILSAVTKRQPSRKGPIYRGGRGRPPSPMLIDNARHGTAKYIPVLESVCIALHIICSIYYLAFIKMNILNIR